MEDEDKTLDGLESFETIQEDSGLGSISINNEVVANIVTMAAREVPGVADVASGGFDIAGLFGARKDGAHGVHITETNEGQYHITVKVLLTFGVQLAKVAQDIQVAVRDQVENMTNKDVAKVDVIVDGVRHPEKQVIQPISDED